MKTLNIHQMGAEGLDELRKEINAMRRLDHPNIVKLFEIFESADSIHMILELCTGGELVAPNHGSTDRHRRADGRAIPLKDALGVVPLPRAQCGPQRHQAR